MDIQEVRDSKYTLEEAIKSLLDSFEKETGVCVTDVKISHPYIPATTGYLTAIRPWDMDVKVVCNL